MPQVSIDVSKISDRALAAYRDTMLLLEREFDQAISSNVWEWPNPPSPRDIIDQGLLKGSKTVSQINETTTQFTWSKDYSLYVHEGYTMKNGARYPGRPWTKYALEKFDIDATYQKLLEARLK